MTQKEAVITTIEHLGGIATLGDLYRDVFNIKECEWKTRTPFASIRRIVQTTPEIFKIKPGLYALRTHLPLLEKAGIIHLSNTSDNAHDEQHELQNHAYYQGLLLETGKMKGYDTFVPQQDKNKLFLGGPRCLKDLRTLSDIPHFSYEKLVQRSSTIDVIWFNNHGMPASFFEVEHSTDIQNSLLKFSDLQDFYVRMYIVADSHRRSEFENKLHYEAFKSLLTHNRVQFLSYQELDRNYEYFVQGKKLKTLF